jgi:subtilisin
MKNYISAIFLVFSLAATPLTVLAVGESSPEKDTRYFIPSTSGFWQNSFSARHSFENGFTADLSDFQLRLAKLAGLKPIPVKKFTILPATEADERPETAGRKPVARQTPSESVPWGVALVGGAVAGGGASISVAILDTGIDTTHPDLKRRVQDCKDFTQAKLPIVNGKCSDQNGHGTHVAGIIAADGGEDGLGIFGVAPAARLKAYKVCGPNGSCWSDDIAVALRTAADNGAQIVNLSLGSDAESTLITDAVNYAIAKGVLVVAAAGNDGPYPGSIDYPGANIPVIAVGALDAELVVAEWSSRGVNESNEPYLAEEGDVEFAAPGVNIESTYPGGGYAILSGTSMATPHVVGLAALVWDVTAEGTLTALHNLALPNDIGTTGDDNASGWGLPKLP